MLPNLSNMEHILLLELLSERIQKSKGCKEDEVSLFIGILVSWPINVFARVNLANKDFRFEGSLKL